MNTKVCETINMIQTQVHTQLIEVQVCPVQPSGTGRRQRTDKNLSVTVQSPESVPTCWQVGELHLKDTAESHTPVETITADTAQSVLVFFFTSGGRGTDEGRSSPSWSQTQNKSFLLWANHRNVPAPQRTSGDFNAKYHRGLESNLCLTFSVRHRWRCDEGPSSRWYSSSGNYILPECS